MVFIVFGAFMFITIGGFFGMMAFSLLGGLATWKKSAIALLVAALSSFLITGGFYTERKSAETAWNNGYCTCGTEWRHRMAACKCSKISQPHDLLLYL